MASNPNTAPSPRPRDRLSTTQDGFAAGSNGMATEPQRLIPPSLSRRVSQNLNMGPAQPPFRMSPSMTGTTGDNSGVGTGPGPLRHPRPITIADLHLELEKEQEAVVNHLTRELSLLRRQTASVASTASSTSVNYSDLTDLHNTTGPSMPVPNRHRSSSTLSSRSIPTSNAANVPGSAATSRETGIPSSRQSLDRHRASFSREPLGTTPPLQNGEYFPHPRSSRHSRSHSQRSSVSFIPGPNPTSQTHPTNLAEQARYGLTSPPTMSRYEEVALHRAEFESVRRENDSLRRRVRELEITLRQYRHQEPEIA